MLSAQYVVAHYLTGRRLPEARAAALLRYFEQQQDDHGTYGLHPHAEPSLFVSTLVYVACRILGVPPESPLLAGCRRLLAQEPAGALRLPTWGRVWLALLGVYPWEGLHAMPVWVFRLPTSLPMHPSRWYCHTRLIYLGVSLLRTEQPAMPPNALTRALRAELYPGHDYARLDFAGRRSDVTPLDRVQDEHPLLGWAYRGLDWAETLERRGRGARWVRRWSESTCAQLREQIRFELRSSAYMGVSPVSGLLGALALYFHTPRDPYVERVFSTLERWVFDDPSAGARVTGARSQTWDTAFALRALYAAKGAGAGVSQVALEATRASLQAQQILEAAEAPERYADFGRSDPRGGFCFSTRDHGWPVSDCTACL
jgi:lanosterol synthase